ncbi:hypothetical protein KRMM14A1259_14590 [Krasilnikovia sp. MM14-A1259]
MAAVSPAPSQDSTTNCGGVSPGASRCATGWCGCGPLSWVLPSPTGAEEGEADGFPDAGAGFGAAAGRAVVPAVPQAARAPTAVPTAPPRKDLLPIATPRSLAPESAGHMTAVWH